MDDLQTRPLRQILLFRFKNYKLIWPILFLNQFNSIYVFQFSRHFRTRGEILFESSGSKKNSRFRGKNQANTPSEMVFMAKIKKNVISLYG